jgi:hypothetical protein
MAGCTYCPDPVFPDLVMRSPPSSIGISRLSPAPEAAEPTFTLPPGNLSAALVSMPDSVAVGRSKAEGYGWGRGIRYTRVRSTDAMLCLVGVEVTLGLLGEDQGVLAFVFLGHDDLVVAGDRLMCNL